MKVRGLKTVSLFPIQPSQVENRVVENTESLLAEGFPRNAIKWRNEIPMTPMAAAFQCAHKNSGA